MKIYTGAPAAARHYVQGGRGRADDYYLAEGTGIARRFAASVGRVQELAPLTGDTYEAWVAGVDPNTRATRGRLREDDRAVRFVEVVVNGPKSWSLAAALHPDIAAAYDQAQDRAAAQIIGWVAEHATTRVGPRGGQVQVPLEVMEAVTVRHHTSRAGDPHRHLHLQVNARVFAAERWRGLHTVGVRDSLAAINGIGHSAVVTDPGFRAALAGHGYTVNSMGEIRELADYVGAFSGRAMQISRNLHRYEAAWTAAHPGQRPGPGLRRMWDARAWAEGRPHKVTPQPGTDIDGRWRAELAALGYRDRAERLPLRLAPIGGLDRDGLAEQALTRLGAGRSAWNAADIRGEVEQLIAAAGVVINAAVRMELAEDLTTRVLDRCVPLLDRDRGAVPEHIRALTSQSVLDVESDLTGRLAARAADPGGGLAPELLLEVQFRAARRGLDDGQAAVVAALAGDGRLLVIEGAAGAGKTTTLAATQDVLERHGRGLVVVTPTLKAAKIASVEVGTAAGSAAWLAFQHGWRWNEDGVWLRLAVGEPDPVTGRAFTGPDERAQLRPGDLLIVDEAGMLDQDTARALVTVADECQVRLALLGDRCQLAAVGRGGVLDLAAGQVNTGAHLTLNKVHRFTRVDRTGRTTQDSDYADLTLAMRTGEDPGAVFDRLTTRRQIQLHADFAAMRGSLARASADRFRVGDAVAVVVNTREQAADLNAAIREQLVADFHVDDVDVVTTSAGQRVGAGDRIVTRSNNRDLNVANRDTWFVTAVTPGGGIVVTPCAVTSPRDQTQLIPTDYAVRYVELGYATTAHGAQGETVTTAHVVVGEHAGAASMYVGMTRGRSSNFAHLIAADSADARAQWIAVFARDGADLGPGHAAVRAVGEADRYAPCVTPGVRRSRMEEMPLIRQAGASRVVAR